MIFVPFELEQVEFGIFIPGIPVPKSLKRNACGPILNINNEHTQD